MARTHVIGAGLSGLAAAVDLVRAGRSVTLHESGSRAGGRCRSYLDGKLKRRIDNGNHLLLSGNRSAMDYLKHVGARDELIGPATARFPFLDLRTGLRWEVRPNPGWMPWWILRAERRVPDTRAPSYLSALRVALAGSGRTVSDCVGGAGALFERFWEPLAVAALNTPADLGSARLLRPVLLETFARGEASCRPRIARRGLSSAFVDPAIDFLERCGARVRMGRRLRGIDYADDRARRLHFGGETVELPRGDQIILAVPPAVARDLVPSLIVPAESNPIVNVHFRLCAPALHPPDLPFLGLIGGTAHWLFVRGDIASITVSAADDLAVEPAEVIACRTWRDASAALGIDCGEELPAWRVVKERRATFAQTPGQIRRRPGTRTGIANLHLAGDWTDTGLPATIEGAIRSGWKAARAVRDGA